MIRINRVSKTFRSGSVCKQVLKEVSLEVPEGRVLFLLGANGAGKSTLLRILSSLLSYDEGSVMVNGLEARDHPLAIKRSIGFLSANTALYERLTGEEFLRYFAALFGLSEERYQQRLEFIESIFSIKDFFQGKSIHFSSGQKQKINISRALLHDPPIYILDEPTMGLDVDASASVLDFIKYAQSQKRTMVIVTHNIEYVQSLHGSIAFLVDGRIAFSGDFETVMRESGGANLTEAYRHYAGR